MVNKKNYPQRKAQVQMVSLMISAKYLKKNKYWLPQTHTNNRREHLWTHFMRQCYLKTKTRKRHYKKKKYHRPIYPINTDAKIFNRKLVNWIWKHIKKIVVFMTMCYLSLGHKDDSKHENQSMWYTTLLEWRIKITQSYQ